MSLHCLKHPGLPATVPDELEGFLHVLLYNATRFLLHNYNPVSPFIQDYYDGYNQYDGRWFSPVFKRTCIRFFNGEHVVYGGQALKFRRSDGSENHALNLILSRLFKMFQARYVVEEYEEAVKDRRKQEEERIRKQGRDVSPSQMPRKNANVFIRRPRRIDREVALKATLNNETDKTSVVAPSAEVLQLREESRKHSLFRHYLNLDYELPAGFSWDHHDKLEYDRLQHYVQTDRVLISADPVERPAKTTRKNHEMPTDLAVTVRAGTA